MNRGQILWDFIYHLQILLFILLFILFIKY